MIVHIDYKKYKTGFLLILNLILVGFLVGYDVNAFY